MAFEVTTLAERPELTEAFWEMADTWPLFVLQEPIGDSHYGRVVAELPEFILVATDASQRLTARAVSVPFMLRHNGNRELPAGGWRQVLKWAVADLRAGRATDTVSAVEITVAPDWQGHGCSAPMLQAMRQNARARGFGELVAPLRPTVKHREPQTPMREYAWRTRDDGLPFDPWIRAHVRAGAVIDSVAPHSMVVAGSLREWRQWTGLPFDADGETVVPQALRTVHCDLDGDFAVYVEPNVWVRHRL